MPQQKLEKCFIIMPFGKKSKNDGTDCSYDFDKVYRVIIRRAVQQAGMEPIRADETKGSGLIHTDMFKDLRDRPVVLADLSLNNPNVFYELGIRHVMSPRGTVLLCCANTELPFDVKLSRTIFYQYDGENLDWEEAERVVRELESALKKAKSGIPDSPVHALLERVMPEKRRKSIEIGDQVFDHYSQRESLDNYQSTIANFWAKGDKSLTELHKENSSSVFGVRSLAYLCLQKETIPPEMTAIARELYSLEQYDLTNKVYEKIEKHDNLEIEDLLKYGSSISESNLTLVGVKHAFKYMNKALDKALSNLHKDKNQTQALRDVTKCYNQLSGIHLWKWKLTKTDEDLQVAIEEHQKADQYSEKVMAKDPTYPLGEVAYNKLKLMLMLRIRDRDQDRVDLEGYRDGILRIKIPAEQHPRDASYLRWYQSITMADAGDEDGSRQLALVAFSEDAKILDKPECSTIGRRQYSLLRRFIEQYSSELRHPTLIGHISQVLQIGHIL